MAARRFLLVGLCACISLIAGSASASGYTFDTANVEVDAPDPNNVQITSSCTSGGSTACVVYDYDWNGARVNSCDGKMVPDLPVHAFYDNQNRVQMLMGTAGDAHRLMGPDLDSVLPEQVAKIQYHYDDARECTANSNLHDRSVTTAKCVNGQPTCVHGHYCEAIDQACQTASQPSSFHNAEWLDSVWTPDGNTVHALMHNEFNGDYWDGQCDFTKPDGCYYSSVTYARSTDGGAFYTHPAPYPPPFHLVAEAPYQYLKNAGHVGFAAPTNILKSGGAWVTIVIARGRGVGPTPPDPSRDGFVYSDADPNYFKDQYTGKCAIRTLQIQDPRSWDAWSNTGFNNKLTDPYTYRLYSVSPPSQHVCAPLIGFTETRADGEWSFMKDFTARSLVLDKSTGHYILIGVCEGRDVFCFSWSSTITGFWSAPVPIMHIDDTCANPATRAQYPSIIDPTPPDNPATTTEGRNFETIDDSDYVDMFFKRFNCVSMSADSDLLRVKLRFTAPH